MNGLARASIASTRPPRTTPSSRCRRPCATTWSTESQSLHPGGVQRQRQPRQRAHRRPLLPEQRARDLLRPADDGPQHRVQERVAGRLDGRDPGLLATGTILNGYARPDTSSPTQRGHMVRSRMLCQDVNPPPPNLDTTFHAVDDGGDDARALRATSTSRAPATAATSCMDWIGFGFENYDGWGRYRTTENGLPIDEQRDRVQRSAGEGRDPDRAVGDEQPGGRTWPASDDVKRCMDALLVVLRVRRRAPGARTRCTYDAIYTEASSNGFGAQERR